MEIYFSNSITFPIPTYSIPLIPRILKVYSNENETISFELKKLEIYFRTHLSNSNSISLIPSILEIQSRENETIAFEPKKWKCTSRTRVFNFNSVHSSLAFWKYRSRKMSQFHANPKMKIYFSNSRFQFQLDSTYSSHFGSIIQQK